MKPPRKKADGDLRAPSDDRIAKNAPGGRVPPEPADEAPDVPGLHTWNAVYWFAFVVFVAVVVALTIFSRVYA